MSRYPLTDPPRSLVALLWLYETTRRAGLWRLRALVGWALRRWWP